MPQIDNLLRDEWQTAFRSQVVRANEIVPFEHQAKWWALTDGMVLTEREVVDAPSMEVKLPDDSVVQRWLVPRPHGRARVVAELGAYKIGKSFGAALWATGFAIVPDARVYLIGAEYDMTAPEFEYLLQFLISDRGMKLPYRSLQDRPKDGRLWLELENGARFEARSWERAENLKGKVADAHIFCEAYQLPGLEAHTNIKQNLRARDGYAIFVTTPDHPWVSILHEVGHGHPDYPEWECQCNIPSSVNPYTFSERSRAQDEQLMTREKYAISHLGRLGTYIGSVFGYQRGDRIFTPATHPQLWHNPNGEATRENFKVPSNWTVVNGADTGTYMAHGIVGFDENGVAFILDENVNYRYIGPTIEHEIDTSMAGWADEFRRKSAVYGARPIGWCDTNSQFKTELINYGITLMGNPIGREARTETLREYFHQGKIWLAPWLRVLPYELENARWPDAATLAGKFERLKINDHLLDTIEHICSRHPRGKPLPLPDGNPNAYHRPKRRQRYDNHLGRV